MKKKRTTAIVISMVFLLITITSAYASFTDIENNRHKEAIEEMARLGILEGIGNNLFAPDTELNRAAAAKVASLIFGYTEEDAVAATKWEPMFGDVHENMQQQRWALGWINLMAKEGILSGYGDGKYHPEDNLQMSQWAAILIRILGYETEEMQSNWPYAYDQMAETLELTTHLDYSGSAIVNRAQMAQMTTTAIFDVERPDGKRIIDIVEFKSADETFQEDEQEPRDEDESYNEGEQHDEIAYENISLSVTSSKSLAPAGGGQTVQITAHVTHGDNLPAQGVEVEFFAHESISGDNRSSQLSATHAFTDADGKATSKYTTIAGDDNKYMVLGAITQSDDDWIDERIYFIASNEASMCEGRIINPFTGEPYPNVDIIFDSVHTDYHIFFEGASDENGDYSIAVQPGLYYIAFFLDLGEEHYYSGSYSGSQYEFKADNTVVLRFNEIEIGKNKEYSFNTQWGIIKGTVNNLGSNRDIYIHPPAGTWNTVATQANEDGTFMVALPDGNYEINAQGGHILKSNVKVEKGKITDLGTFSR